MRELKLGIVGAGIWGANHARVFNTLPQTRLVAVCDISPERANAFKEQSGCKA
ncbi:Gfo/Idh/MocA family oxidoreductase [Sinorhizobium meliloti]|uniref:Gfo/Idh/MocA family oxidoreductase n=1 Tax=Rhizobium meliloti TaxID=382 RepID=UPI001F1ABE63|nr:Gfo/Idh/MocA family oxidoreductase [Sinorhizobium meliloti]